MHDPLFHLGPLLVHPFGFFAALGIVAGYVVALWQAGRAGLSQRYLPGMLVVVVLGGFIAARLGYVARHPGSVSDGIQGVLALWRGGLSLDTGIIGAAVLLALVVWARREPWWRWTDALAPAAAVGLGIGMLGLPLAGEGWGKPTGGPFSMAVDATLLPVQYINDARFAPIFAYEAVFFAVLAVFLLTVIRRQRRLGRPPAGTAGLLFLALTMIAYAAVRPLTLDADNAGLVLATQVLCAAAAAVALVLLVPRIWRARLDAEVTREIEAVRRRREA